MKQFLSILMIGFAPLLTLSPNAMADDEVVPNRLEILEGMPVSDGIYLNCIVDNDFEFPMSVRRVEYNFACGHPANVFHVRYRCGETPQNCTIAVDDYQQFAGPSMYNCYLIQPHCLVRYELISEE